MSTPLPCPRLINNVVCGVKLMKNSETKVGHGHRTKVMQHNRVLGRTLWSIGHVLTNKLRGKMTWDEIYENAQVYMDEKHISLEIPALQ